jgi:hypothetical protein
MLLIPILQYTQNMRSIKRHLHLTVGMFLRPGAHILDLRIHEYTTQSTIITFIVVCYRIAQLYH